MIRTECWSCGDMLGVGLSTDGGKSWQATYGFKCWEMADITWHPTDPMTVWVGGAMAARMSAMTAGATGRRSGMGMPPPLGLGNSAPVEKVLFDPKDATHLLALGGSSRRWDMHTWDKAALGASGNRHDGGEHWTRLTTLTAEGHTNDPDAKPGVNIVSGGFGGGPSQIDLCRAGRARRPGQRGRRQDLDGPQGGPAASQCGARHPPPHRPEHGLCRPGQPPEGRTRRLSRAASTKARGRRQDWVSISNGLRQNTGTDRNFVARYKGFAVCEANPRHHVHQ